MATRSDDESIVSQQKTAETVKKEGSAAFQSQYFFRDTAAGLITGAMAIPLTIGIAIMSNYPIKVGLATVAFASLIGWINAWFKPGNLLDHQVLRPGWLQCWRWVWQLLVFRIWHFVSA